MRHGGPRRTAPGLLDGRVQRKNRHEPTPSYWNTVQASLVIDRQRPGPGYRHLLRNADIERFAALLPQWDELSVGLDAVILAPGEGGDDGWCDDGVIAICAWPREVVRWWWPSHVAEHAEVLDQLGVPRTREGDVVRCDFTEATARGFQLLHVFLHELGHHWDRMTTRTRLDTARGEAFAEAYALRHGAAIRDRYADVFGL